MPMKNSGLTWSALLRLALSLQNPSGIEAEPRRLRLDVGFAEEERDANPEQHHRDADRDIVDPRQAADRSMHCAKGGAGDAGRENAEPRIAGVVGGGVGDHCAEHQRSFEPEIHPARFFGQAFAERDEHERRRDADGAAEHSDKHRKQRGFVHVRPRSAGGLKMEKRP